MEWSQRGYDVPSGLKHLQLGERRRVIVREKAETLGCLLMVGSRAVLAVM